MVNVTPQPSPLQAFDNLLDRERSRAFHRGELAFSLELPRALLAALPEGPDPALSVQIVGSEGKTSTALLLSAALAAHGLSVGSFTSPHLHDARERMRVNLELPNDAALAEAVEQVYRASTTLPAAPSWFEMLACCARQLFAAEGLDAQVWEAGLGGRLDVTTLMPAKLLVLSSVSLEHAAILGESLEQIAAEKLGALRPGVALLLAADLPRVVRKLAEQTATACDARLFDAPPPRASETAARARALARGACEALRALELLPAESSAERAALSRTEIPGRDLRYQDLLIDAAHSVAACADLATRLAADELGWLVFGATSGRDAAQMLAPLLPLVEGVVLTSVPGGREQSAEDLAASLPSGTLHEIEPAPEAALARARELSSLGRRILVTGSLYLLAVLLPRGSNPT